ncbi:MAG: hypothetical protein JWO78_1340 [Micavibrio sp.]|nr:hypothetical protein [Micavibrio sp.]
MGITVIDRRQDPQEDKFGTDRQRFLERYRDLFRKAVGDLVGEGNIKDLVASGGAVPIPKRMISEPVVHHGQGGKARRVFPGLIKFDVGDRIPKPEGGGGGRGSGEPSADGDGEDEYVWLSPEELLNILFDGRRLPDMTKLKAPQVKVVDRQHAGYTSKGPAHRMDMDITNRKRAGEALVLSKMSEKRVIDNLAEQYNIYASYEASVPKLNLSDKSKSERRNAIIETVQSLQKMFHSFTGKSPDDEIVSLLSEAVQIILKENVGSKIDSEADQKRLQILEARLIDQIKAGRDAGRYRPDHLTYEYDDDVPKPGAKAVMFCMMDVSYSMTQERKNIAKSFFFLMNAFLTTAYENTDVIFISHTTKAEEVDEKTFFYGTETGGTVVSTCLIKMKEIIDERYPPSDWNIYGVQASDGENSQNDNHKVIELMQKIMPLTQSYYYIQVEQPSYGERLLPVFKDLAEEFPGRVYTAELDTPADGLDAFNHFFPTDGSMPTKPSFVP